MNITWTSPARVYIKHSSQADGNVLSLSQKSDTQQQSERLFDFIIIRLPAARRGHGVGMAWAWRVCRAVQ